MYSPRHVCFIESCNLCCLFCWLCNYSYSLSEHGTWSMITSKATQHSRQILWQLTLGMMQPWISENGSCIYKSKDAIDYRLCIQHFKGVYSHCEQYRLSYSMCRDHCVITAEMFINGVSVQSREWNASQNCGLTIIHICGSKHLPNCTWWQK